MNGRAQKVRLGIFVLICSALLLLTIGYFAAQRLFEKTDTYFVSYRDVSVSGLEVGSPVKYLGITVGSISDIYIDPNDVSQVTVKLSLRQGTPIKQDATADIVAMGITGLKMIEIRGGTKEAGYLGVEQHIRQGSSLVEDISGRAEVIAYKAEEVLNNLMLLTHPDNVRKIPEAIDKVSALADNANRSVDLLSEVVHENRPGVKQLVEHLGLITERLEQTTAHLYAAADQINRTMQSDTIGEVLGNIRDVSQGLRESNLRELIDNLAQTTLQTQQILQRLDSDIDRSSREVEESLLLLRNTLENLEETSRRVSADPSLLIRGQSARDTPDRKLQ